MLFVITRRHILMYSNTSDLQKWGYTVYCFCKKIKNIQTSRRQCWKLNFRYFVNSSFTTYLLKNVFEKIYEEITHSKNSGIIVKGYVLIPCCFPLIQITVSCFSQKLIFPRNELQLNQSDLFSESTATDEGWVSGFWRSTLCRLIIRTLALIREILHFFLKFCKKNF